MITIPQMLVGPHHILYKCAFPWALSSEIKPRSVLFQKTNTHSYQLRLCMGLSQLSSALPSSRTSSFCMSTFILFWWCGLLVTSMVSGNNETDRLALLEFKAKITLDPFGVMTSWNNGIHFCQWRGVTCGRRHQRVTVLDLYSLKLVGSISPHVGNLSFLRNLTLQNNTFHNEIPQEIGRLHKL